MEECKYKNDSTKQVENNNDLACLCKGCLDLFARALARRLCKDSDDLATTRE